MKYTVEIVELKKSLAAMSGLMKKMPGELQKATAPVALMNGQGGTLMLVGCFDWFSASIPLETMELVGSDGLVEYDGGSSIARECMIGIVGYDKMLTVLSKLDSRNGATIDIVYESDDPFLTVKSVSNGAEYQFDVSDANKVIAIWPVLSSGEQVCTMSSDEFESFCSVAQSMSDIVVPSVQNPAFGCVCVSTDSRGIEKDAAGKNLVRVSGNSDSEGFSIAVDTDIEADKPFSLLLRKELASGLGTFLKQMGGMPDGEVTFKTRNVDGASQASDMQIESDSFSLWLSCTTDTFPFSMVTKIIEACEGKFAACTLDVSLPSVSKALDREMATVRGKNPVTELTVTDGGAIVLKQHGGYVHSTPTAEERLDCCVSSFDAGQTSMDMFLRTDIMKKILTQYPSANADMSMTLKTQNMSPKLHLTSIGNGIKYDGVMLGLRG